ncbi:hypothetical protein [Bosea lathyri]|uniref:hypothetical protein n=1 Tax=Bosea lathyri TaxID=1036778 RepID=UPI0011B01466|nr:hypothetical protein [Bosea lathyri]
MIIAVLRNDATLAGGYDDGVRPGEILPDICITGRKMKTRTRRRLFERLLQVSPVECVSQGARLLKLCRS